MPRKTDSNNPGDWLHICTADLEGIQRLVADELAYAMCRSKLAEVLEKVLKAELIRLGWKLEKTHDLEVLFERLKSHGSELAPLADPLCTGLAEAYFTDRYPGFDEDDSDWPKLRGQLQQVMELLAKVQARLTAKIGP